MSKSILYVHHTPSFVGSARSLSYLLRELDRSRFVPSMLLTQPGPVETAFRDLGLAVHRLPMRHIWEAPSPRWFNLRNQIRNWFGFFPDRRFAAFLREHKPDLVHLNDTALLPAALTARQLGIPVVCHVRSVHRLAGLLQARSRLLVKRITETSARLIAIGEEYALQFGDADNVAVIYNSLDFAAIDAARGTGAPVRAELGIAPDTFLVGMVGSLTRHKGAWDYIEALGTVFARLGSAPVKACIVGTIPGPRLHHRLRQVTRLAGPRAPRDRAAALAARLGIADRLVLTGHRADIYSVIDALDLVVFPTRLDATGRPVMEGAALGKPTVAAVPTKQTNVLLDGVTGLIVPPEKPAALAEAICALAGDRERAHEMGDRGRERARRLFSAAANIEPVHQIYEEILGCTQ